MPEPDDFAAPESGGSVRRLVPSAGASAANFPYLVKLRGTSSHYLTKNGLPIRFASVWDAFEYLDMESEGWRGRVDVVDSRLL